MLKRILRWALPVFAAVAFSTVLFVTVLGIQLSADRERNDRVVCVAVNRINAAAVGLIEDFLDDPRVSPAERQKAIEKTQVRFPRLDCTSAKISFR